VAGRDRLLAPLGGTPDSASHKGYGLAAAVEILSAVLPGIPPRLAGAVRRAQVGHFLLALDPARFRPRDAFLAEVDGFIDALHGTAPAFPDRPVLVAGDPEHAHLTHRSRFGIPLARQVFEDLRAVAASAGVPFLLERKP
jgi:LDH2 family malate/lactate/ureidoglycolate dehydrogenase